MDGRLCGGPRFSAQARAHVSPLQVFLMRSPLAGEEAQEEEEGEDARPDGPATGEPGAGERGVRKMHCAAPGTGAAFTRHGASDARQVVWRAESFSSSTGVCFIPSSPRACTSHSQASRRGSKRRLWRRLWRRNLSRRLLRSQVRGVPGVRVAAP